MILFLNSLFDLIWPLNYMYTCDLSSHNIMEVNIGHLLTKFGYKQAYGWNVINPNSLEGKLSHLTSFDLLTWPLTPEYHGGQYRASPKPSLVTNRHMVGELSTVRVLHVKLSHLTSFDLWTYLHDLWPQNIMEANIGHQPTKFGYKQAYGWKVINLNGVLQVNFHILPHLTFDLLTWPLTS